MSVIRTNAAAAMLGVSPNTLRSWEERFGYPAPRRTGGGHRQFELSDIEALRQAFEETGDISSAVSIARERGEGPSSPVRLRAALMAFCESKADRLLEESLALRSVERTVESVLLPAVESLPPGGPERAFALRYATGWLAAATRVAPPASRPESVLIFDACAPEEPDSLHAQALELFLRRQGLRVLTLPAALEPARVGNALRALQPAAIVLAGEGAAADAVSRLVYAARQACAEVSVFQYRSGASASPSTVRALGPGPMAAAESLREWLLDPERLEQSQPRRSPHARRTA